MADQIINKGNQQVLAAVAEEIAQCMRLGSRSRSRSTGSATLDADPAALLAKSAAMTELLFGHYEIRNALLVLQDVIRRMASLPGQRSVLLVSSGFLLGDRRLDSVDVMDRAIRSNVVINTLDARGLYVDTAFKADNSGGHVTYQRETDRLRDDILRDLADATGGTFIHNTNDLLGGIRRLASAPEYIYILAFSPKGLKHDGKYHPLKVTVTEPKLTVFARKGYFAPKEITPQQAARRDIEDVLFSQQEIREIPIDLHTEFFKSAAGGTRLSVVSRIDVSGLAFRKDADQNRDSVTVVSVLFDGNGKLIDGVSQTIELSLRDRTLRERHTGIPVESSFDVKPGRYVVRVVVRDTEGSKISAASAGIEIP